MGSRGARQLDGEAAKGAEGKHTARVGRDGSDYLRPPLRRAPEMGDLRRGGWPGLILPVGCFG